VLAKKTSTLFSKSSRMLGETFVQSDLAKVIKFDDDSITGSVEGGDSACVKLKLCGESSDDDHLHADCDCALFNRQKLCQHIWALVLLADNHRWGGTVRRYQGVLDIEFGCDEDGDHDDEDHDDDGGDTDDWYVEEDAALDSAAYPFLPNRAPTRAQRIEPSVESLTTNRVHWEKLLEDADAISRRGINDVTREESIPSTTKHSELLYGLHLNGTKAQGELTINLFQRHTRVNGSWGVAKPFKLSRIQSETLDHPADQEIISLMFGGQAQTKSSSYYDYYYEDPYWAPAHDLFKVSPPLYDVLLPKLAATGRFYFIEFNDSRPAAAPLTYSCNDAWIFELAVTAAKAANSGSKSTGQPWILTGRFRRGAELMTVTTPKLVLRSGLVMHEQDLGRIPALSNDEFFWISRLREQGPVMIPQADLDRFVETLTRLPLCPRIELPESTTWQTKTGTPTPRLSIMAASASQGPGQLTAKVNYQYDGITLSRSEGRSSWVDNQAKIIHKRDASAELKLFEQLLQQPQILHATSANKAGVDVSFASAELPALVKALSDLGWSVEAEGRRLRQSGNFAATVSSGINWFDVGATCNFGGQTATLPALIAALERGDNFIKLGDGSLGLLPTEWLKKFGAIADMGKRIDDGIRFTHPQGALLDALLDGLPAVDVDSKFAAMRDRLKAFNGIEPQQPDAAFKGSLREYQCEGLGWLNFLSKYGFGGCLADDMGLGKTIQVLAMLQQRCANTKRKRKPSVVIVPRSLVHNWLKEAQRFCPDLRLLDFASADRHDNWDSLSDYDVIITTYGVLRRDIEKLCSVEFDYAILDEAQAIKNDAAQTAKAARLVQADHRLALSGTPVENHLGDLASIFEFLNPGMLSTSLFSTMSKKTPEDALKFASLLARALRPFILRRTKAQVLKDLPEKTEQTIYCSLEPQQRRLYDELRDHYRARLTKTVKEQGMKRSKIHVVEALLRLRQAACHPGLIDKTRSHESSAKLDALLDQLREVIESGHKALVFSQFTSMLALVRERLGREKFTYEYLDGRTRDREARVTRFQTDPEVPLFLISLKAGGLGLNLTAADYCFILDPWWNPAAEAQAIDRAHRMGQTKPVFAYRLIAKDTVEEKILALQEKKRDLADAVVSAENSVLGSLTFDDLQLLLS